jgi:hypothetical protein
MKNSFVSPKLTACAAAVLLCCSMLFIQSKVKAQCPTDIPPTTCSSCTAWATYSKNYPIPGTSCSFTVYYCLRLVGDAPSREQLYISKIVPNGNNDCRSYTPEQLIGFAEGDLMLDGTVWPIIPCCGDPNVDPYPVEIYSPQCWYTPTTWTSADPVPGGGKRAPSAKPFTASAALYSAIADPAHGRGKSAAWAKPLTASGALYSEIDACVNGAYCVRSCKICGDCLHGGAIEESDCSTSTIGTSDCASPPDGYWYANVCYSVGCTE